MSCLFPLQRARLKSGLVVSPNIDYPKDPQVALFHVPCGQCGECRLSRARSWATRCVHEATLWQRSCFITLTYKDTPSNNSLDPSDTRNFIRRFRDQFKKPFKYFLVGEYGEKNDRPHYHALIFGHDFGYSNRHHIRDPLSKKVEHEHLTSFTPLHDTEAMSCQELNDIWQLGHTSVGELTFDSAAYCAQYAMKKVTGSKAALHYGSRHPEFMRTSQNAIGKQYALRYAEEIIRNNSTLSNGVEQPIPNYYLKLYEKQNHDLTQLRQKREEFSETHTLEKSYIRACKLDAKFKNKKSKADAFRLRYATDRYFDLTKNNK